MSKEQSNQEENKALHIGSVSGSTLRTYAENCPNCGSTAKLETKKYCCDKCKIEYKAKLERKFG